MVTARFVVGTSADAAILRVHEKISANIDRIPKGIPEPLIVGRGIDDVAIMVLTLSPKAEAAARWTPSDLTRVAHEVQVAVASLPEIGLTYIAVSYTHRDEYKRQGEYWRQNSRLPEKHIAISEYNTHITS